MTQDIIKAAAGAAAGAMLAWTAHSFTIDGQMRAFEAQLNRIEQRLDKIVERETRGTKP
ncbi:hypothetical protein [Roseateles sp.]|uniref:hypothetical protein n=1 Tax=Roseateles sp. TaxID=1971397 RepID=UPI002DFC1AEC|nr:hypothetical protein [Roseateles sp.]